VDNRILKLDSAIQETALRMNQPLGKYSVERIEEQFKQFNNQFILQTMLLKGSFNKQEIDNTTEIEIQAYLDLLIRIRPEKVMIYTIARDTPVDTLEKIPADKMNSIADRIRQLNINVEVSF